MSHDKFVFGGQKHSITVKEEKQLQHKVPCVTSKGKE